MRTTTFGKIDLGQDRIRDAVRYDEPDGSVEIMYLTDTTWPAFRPATAKQAATFVPNAPLKD